MRTLKSFATLLAAAVAVGAAPSITAVYNSASYAPPDLSNGFIAQGSIFIVTGSGLGPGQLQQVTSYPLPTTGGIGGTSIQVVVNSQAFDCPMIYSSDGQVAAILPSRTVIGTGSLNLLYQGIQATFAIHVVQSSFGMFTVNEAGSGPGIVTDTSYKIKTPINPAHPGDVLIGWGTGLGATTSDETQPPAQVDLKSGVAVYVGGQHATVLYGGRGSSPGLDQINFMVPAGVSGCYVSVAVQVRNVTSNFTTLAIAPPGQSACADPENFTSSDLQKMQSAGKLNIGRLNFIRTPGAQDQAFANFQPLDFLGFIGATGIPSAGSCAVSEYPAYTESFTPLTGLDAGTLTLNGPSGPQTLKGGTGMYSANLGASLNPGTYTISASGGANVGSFTTSFTIPQPIKWTNFSSSMFMPRGQDYLVTFSGAGANDIVELTGTTVAQPTSAGPAATFQFVCAALGSFGQLTVPGLVTAMLPLNGQNNGLAGITLNLSGVPVTTFTARGLDTGYIYSMNAVQSQASIQ